MKLTNRRKKKNAHRGGWAMCGIAAALCLALSGCGQNAVQPKPSEEALVQQEAAPQETSAPQETPAESGEVKIAQEGKNTILNYPLPEGAALQISLTLPEGVSLLPKEDAAEDTAAETFAPPAELPVLVLMQNETVVGTLSLCEYAAADAETLTGLDPAQQEIPMAVYATINLANHVDYGNEYTVAAHSETGSSATCRMLWQDLSTPGYEGRAAELPWQEKDCVLAFDTVTLPECPMFLLLQAEPDVISAAAWRETAASVAFSVQR